MDNQDTERCPEYGAAVVLDVAIAPSPDWVRWRLYSLGVRPISNVVDVTNLLLLGFGQPMHAFDLDRVRDSRIVVRRARQGEPFTTLDGVERVLDADDLVICDGAGPSALAGVMGGADSEIKDSTRRVLLECAYFTPRGVRRTSRRHALHTESSFRFERGVDWGAIPAVLEHAKALLAELAGGAPVPGAIRAGGAPLAVPRMRLRSKRLDALLGVHVPFDDATRTLTRLGLEVGATEEHDGDRAVDVTGASWRPDLAREVDLIEEVARVRGMESIPTLLPAIAPQPPRTAGKLERSVSEIAQGIGLSEALTYAFVSGRELSAVSAPAPVVSLANPLTEERSVMRTSLLPGLLEALRRARRYGERSVRLFSVGARFLPPAAGARSPAAASARPHRDGDRGVLPEERPSFAAVLAGPRPVHLAADSEDHDVYDAKGVAFAMVERLTHRAATLGHAPGAPHTQHLHPRGAAEIRVDDTPVGVLGPLHPDVSRRPRPRRHRADRRARSGGAGGDRQARAPLPADSAATRRSPGHRVGRQRRRRRRRGRAADPRRGGRAVRVGDAVRRVPRRKRPCRASLAGIPRRVPGPEGRHRPRRRARADGQGSRRAPRAGGPRCRRTSSARH